MAPGKFGIVGGTFPSGPSWVPGLRQAGGGVTFQIDMGNLPTLPDRMGEYLQAALIFHLKDPAEEIIEYVRQHSKALPHPKGGPPVGPHVDQPGGRDTGKLDETLAYHLVEGLLATGVWYDILSDEAEYWKWVEFGHWVAAKDGDWFWQGYHLMEKGVMDKIPRIKLAVRMAWADTAVKLAAEARMPTPGLNPGGTSSLLRR